MFCCLPSRAERHICALGPFVNCYRVVVRFDSRPADVRWECGYIRRQVERRSNLRVTFKVELGCALVKTWRFDTAIVIQHSHVKHDRDRASLGPSCYSRCRAWLYYVTSFYHCAGPMGCWEVSIITEEGAQIWG